MIEKYLYIFRCPRDGGSLVSDNSGLKCSICGENYIAEGNIIHFISRDEERPFWSKQLEISYRDYTGDQLLENIRNKYNNSDLQKSFIDFITENSGIIVDLASGPSGYFSGMFNHLSENSILIGTDACKPIIKMHSLINKDKPFLMVDVDLDKALPFANQSIDNFIGNLLSNVENYKNLISEISRCLKPGGRFAVREIFFEHNSQTYDYLIAKNAVYASLEHFIAVCGSAGLKYEKHEDVSEITGKIDKGDLLPIDENDKTYTKNIYFTKK